MKYIADTRTDQELNIIIAQWQGWKFEGTIEHESRFGDWGSKRVWCINPQEETQPVLSIPNCCQDLGAVTLAITKLVGAGNFEDRNKYIWGWATEVYMMFLVCVHTGINPDDYFSTDGLTYNQCFDLITCSCREKAEALVMFIERTQT